MVCWACQFELRKEPERSPSSHYSQRMDAPPRLTLPSTPQHQMVPVQGPGPGSYQSFGGPMILAPSFIDHNILITIFIYVSCAIISMINISFAFCLECYRCWHPPLDSPSTRLPVNYTWLWWSCHLIAAAQVAAPSGPRALPIQEQLLKCG